MSFHTLLTATGAADFIAAQASGATVPFTHMVFGDGNGLAVTPAESMTALVNEVYRVPVNSVSVDADNPASLIIEATVPTSAGGWTVREIGLIGGSAPGKLLAVGNFPETYKPLPAEGSGRDLVVRMIVQVGNASLVEISIDPAVALATKQFIADMIAAHEDREDPHTQYLKAAQKGARNGLATLGSDGLVPLAQLPPAIATDADLAAALAAHTNADDPHPQYLNNARAANAAATNWAEQFFMAAGM
ncbi:MAG: phage tail protein [Duganella sp.]